MSTETETVAAETTAPKSIVPNKYAGKYKNGGSDPVAEFVKAQSYENGAVVPQSFFSLCRVNGLDEAKIAHYEAQVADKLQGAAGRARMTLGNMLRSLARKNGKLLDQAGKEVAIEGLEKPALGGAAANAAAAKADTTTAAPTGDTAEVDDEAETE